MSSFGQNYIVVDAILTRNDKILVSDRSDGYDSMSIWMSRSKLRVRSQNAIKAKSKVIELTTP
jgi:hypothetical protein